MFRIELGLLLFLPGWTIHAQQRVREREREKFFVVVVVVVLAAHLLPPGVVASRQNIRGAARTK